MGLQRAGFQPAHVVEWDRYCCDTLLENRERGVEILRNWDLTAGDVRNFDFGPFEDKLDLVSGGPPCQPFSLGGRHRAHNDARDMFPEAIRAVREIRPKAFIFENVKGLTRQSFRSYFEYIRLQLEFPEVKRKRDESWNDHLGRLERKYTSGNRLGLCYRVVSQVLNAADYGVPQRRERVFFVGFREDLNVRWSFPLPTHTADALIWDKLYGTYWERHRVPSKQRFVPERSARQIDMLKSPPNALAWTTVRDALSDLPDPECEARASGKYFNHRFQPGARIYKGHTGSVLDEPAKTLKAGVHGVPGGENMVVLSDSEVRYFTVRECARLQTFPDDFLFHGSWSETMRQLGNAVPVRLAEVIGADIGARLVSAL